MTTTLPTGLNLEGTTNRREVLTRLMALGGLAGLAGAGGLAASVQPAVAQTSFPMEELLDNAGLEDKALGNKDAKVTVIEYASLTCGHCGNFHRNVYPAIKEKYIEPGKIYFIMRDYPLGDYAAAAAMLARYMPDDKYFPFVDLLMKTQNEWAYVAPNQRLATLFDIAKQAGFTREKFEQALRDQALLDKIRAVQNRARDKFGVNSTPTFFINGEVLRGNPTLETMSEKIDALL